MYVNCRSVDSMDELHERLLKSFLNDKSQLFKGASDKEDFGDLSDFDGVRR